MSMFAYEVGGGMVIVVLAGLLVSLLLSAYAVSTAETAMNKPPIDPKGQQTIEDIAASVSKLVAEMVVEGDHAMAVSIGAEIARLEAYAKSIADAQSTQASSSLEAQKKMSEWITIASKELEAMTADKKAADDRLRALEERAEESPDETIRRILSSATWHPRPQLPKSFRLDSSKGRTSLTTASHLRRGGSSVAEEDVNLPQEILWLSKFRLDKRKVKDLVYHLQCWLTTGSLVHEVDSQEDSEGQEKARLTVPEVGFGGTSTKPVSEDSEDSEEEDEQTCTFCDRPTDDCDCDEDDEIPDDDVDDDDVEEEEDSSY